MAGNTPIISRDSFSVGKRYTRLRVQSGTPVGDFDLNEMQDIQRFALRLLADQLFGRGRVQNAAGESGFRIEQSSSPTNNFEIKAGSVLVSGQTVKGDADFDYEDDTANYLFEGVTRAVNTVSPTQVEIQDSDKKWIVAYDLPGCRIRHIPSGDVFEITTRDSLTQITVDGEPAGSWQVGDAYRIFPPALTTPGGTRTDEVYVEVFLDDFNENEDIDRIDPITGIETSHATKLAFAVRVKQNGSTPADTEATFGSDGTGVWREKLATIVRTGSTIVTAEITNEQHIKSVQQVSEDVREAFTSDNFPVEGAPTLYTSLDERLEELADFIRADIAQAKGQTDAGANWDTNVDAYVTAKRLAERYRQNGFVIEMGVGLYFDPAGPAGAKWYREIATGGGFVLEARSGGFRIQNAVTFGGSGDVATWVEWQFQNGVTRAATLPGKIRFGYDDSNAVASTDVDLEGWDGSAYKSVLTQIEDIMGGPTTNWYDTVQVPGVRDSLYDLTARVNGLEVVIGDATTLGGLTANQFVRSDVADTVQGILTFESSQVLFNTKAIRGKDTGGTARDLVQVNATDQAVLGSTALVSRVLSSGTVLVDESIAIPNTEDYTITSGPSLKTHVTRHAPGGADALGTAAPVTVGTANVEGAGTNFARATHVHDHGSQTTSAHHALASLAADRHGFMSSEYAGLLKLLYGANHQSWPAITNQVFSVSGNLAPNLGPSIFICKDLTIDAGVVLDATASPLVIIALGDVVIDGDLVAQANTAYPASVSFPGSAFHYGPKTNDFDGAFGGGIGCYGDSGSPSVHNTSAVASLTRTIQTALSTVGRGGERGNENDPLFPSGVGAGVVAIFSTGSITLAATGSITANGGDGTDTVVPDNPGAGGGGGAVFLCATTSIVWAGAIEATGGDGGNQIGGNAENGGGGGLIIVESPVISVTTGTSAVSFGSGGTGTINGNNGTNGARRIWEGRSLASPIFSV